MDEDRAGLPSRYLAALKRALLDPHRGDAAIRAALRSATRPVPVLWLLGKTQAGTASIIIALTGHPHAQVGNGYAACTRTAMTFDCPPGVPVIRFLDTRGLGEVAYDPAEDIAACAGQAHLIVAVCRAADPQQDAVFDVLRQVRKTHRDWGIVVAQTGLHDLYEPGQDHLQPYPFAGDLDAIRAARPDLLRALVAPVMLIASRQVEGQVPTVGVEQPWLRRTIDAGLLMSRTAIEPKFEPATDEVIGKVPHASKADLDLALASAHTAFQTWRKSSPLDRSADADAHFTRQRRKQGGSQFWGGR